MAPGTKTVIFAALIGNTLIAVTKFIAAAITGSSAMLSEGIHSVVDTGNQVLLLYGLHRAKQPADELYPFGHGKEVYFWGFVVAILIFAVGAGISIYEGIHHLLGSAHAGSFLASYIVLGLAIVFESFSLFFALREFRHAKGGKGNLQAVRESKDPNLFVVLFEDLAAMAGLLVALIGIGLAHATGNPDFDGVASICIGLILGGTAAWLAYETKGLLIGESADPKIVRGIREIARKDPGIKQVNEVLTMHMGPEFVLVNLSADFADQISAADVEVGTAKLDKQIKAAYPQVKRIFIEARQ